MNGIDNLKAYSDIFKGKRIGLITNPSGVDKDLNYTTDILAQSFNLTALFGPEHGVRGDAQDGKKVEDFMDPILNIPVYSLHGRTLHISDEQFSQIDLLAYDIQDVGARFYTYLYTLSYAMEDAARNHIPVVVFDRVNPLGNMVAEGVLLEAERFKSFVGMYPIPTRYALTIGEYARYINKTFDIGCDLIVIPCENYKRDTQFKDTGLCWINPSPNIPTQESALVYIGTCLFEGTNVSEGRGTTHPFELIGAPFIDASKLAGSLNAMKLPGIRWRPAHFTPMFSKFANELCHGVQLHITDPIAFRPFEAGLRLFDEIRQNCPELKFYSGHFDHLIGTDTLRLGTESVDHMIERAKAESQAFMEQTQPFRIY